MFSRKVVLLGLLIIVLLPLSCAELDSTVDIRTENLVEEKLPENGSIPMKYGNLVSVSSVAKYPDFLQLWFQNENGDLRMVRYIVSKNCFLIDSHLIPRQ